MNEQTVCGLSTVYPEFCDTRYFLRESYFMGSAFVFGDLFVLVSVRSIAVHSG